MTSKEIITRLIDEHHINGEEAYILINDILRGEMVSTYEILQSKTTAPWWNIQTSTHDLSTNTISK